MEILNDFDTSVKKALEEIDSDYQLYKGLVICGSHTLHSQYEIERMINKIKEAREHGIPTLLICAGHQLGAIEYARSIGIKNATSEEFGRGTFVVKKRPHLKIGLHDGESWWSNYEVAIDWKIPEHFVSVPYHPEYQSSKNKPHKDLLKFIELCKHNVDMHKV